MTPLDLMIRPATTPRGRSHGLSRRNPYSQGPSAGHEAYCEGSFGGLLPARIVPRLLVEKPGVLAAPRTRKMRNPLCQNESTDIGGGIEPTAENPRLGDAATRDGCEPTEA